MHRRDLYDHPPCFPAAAAGGASTSLCVSGSRSGNASPVLFTLWEIKLLLGFFFVFLCQMIPTDAASLFYKGISASPLRAAGTNPKARDKPGLYLYLIKRLQRAKNSHVYLPRPTLCLIFPSSHPAESTPPTYISFRRILKTERSSATGSLQPELQSNVFPALIS